MAKKSDAKKGNPNRVTNQPVKQKSSSVRKQTATSTPDLSIWIFLGLSAIIFLQTRIKLLAIPLERDEGSFAYIGHWLLRGRELYTDMLDSKLPGLYAIYGTFTTLFGLNSTGVHIGLFVANVVSAICLFLLVRDLYNKFVAAIATSFFLFMVVSPNMVGFATHATQLLTPFVLGSFLLFWRGIHSNKLWLFFLAGLLMGIAFSIKQQSAIFGVLLALLWWPVRLLWQKKENAKLPIKEWVLLGIGGLIPLILILGYFWKVGRLDEFYNWTYIQPIRLAGSFAEPWHAMFLRTVPKVLNKFEAIWLLAATGVIFILISGFKRMSVWFGISTALLGILSVVIGAAYYSHYFILAIPGIVLLAACSLNWLANKTGKAGNYIALGIAAVLIIISMSGRTDYYFDPDYSKIHFNAYKKSMFPEMEQIGKELAKRVPEGEKIGILGSEPEILVAAGRESCSKHLMVYSLLSDPELSPPMQIEFSNEIKACAPDYIVYNVVNSSWTTGYEKLAFFKELIAWVDQNYTTIAMAESREDKPGIVVWDEALRRHTPQSDFRVYVMQKKPVSASDMFQ